jgi:hypothetical protein
MRKKRKWLLTFSQPLRLVSCMQSRGIAAFAIFKSTAGMTVSSASKAFTYFRKIYEMVTEGGQVVPQVI